MSFWDVTKRLLTGKPAFEAPKSDDDWDDDAPTTDFAEDREAKRVEKADTDLYDESGNKQIPVAGVTHTKYDPRSTYGRSSRITLRDRSC